LNGEMKYMSIVVIAICIAGIVYIMFIRPRLRQRKAISDTREWLKGIGVPIPDKPEPIDVTNLPNGSRVITDIRKHWGPQALGLSPKAG
jgi:hypothetical protein